METGTTEELFSQEPYALICLLDTIQYRKIKTAAQKLLALLYQLCTATSEQVWPVPNTEGQKYKS